jgi:phosphoribosylamine---glycine ligase
VRVLVVGAGGREHALAWGLARSPEVSEVVVAPGNPGTEPIGRRVPLDVRDPAAVAQLADDLDIDLVVVGPEEPLVLGAADAVAARGRVVFGPVAAGARLEGSKAWMKEILVEAGVPTARHGSFTEEAPALALLAELGPPFVVKTDGLAAGKGVVVTPDRAEAVDAVRSYLSGAAFGDAGRVVVIEEGLSGPELSVLVVTDGERAVALAPARDHKRVGEGDTGPNTGGMGAYSPVPGAGDDIAELVVEQAVMPTLAALRARGIDYRGVLYAGLMLTPDGPKVLEYNVRFGDPECQVVVPRLASGLATLCLEAAEGRLRSEVRWTSDAAVTVVLASEGYPAAPRTGDVIEGLDAAAHHDGVTVFHAGTARDGAGRVVTAGGRVLAVTGTGHDLREARDRAYAAVGEIRWPGQVVRGDIAREP